MKVTCEIPAHGTPPSAIAKNLESVLRLLCPQVETLELPNVDRCRKCRGIVQIVSETGTACEVGLSLFWNQVFFEETQRKTVPLTAFATAVMEDEGLRSIVLSY